MSHFTDHYTGRRYAGVLIATIRHWTHYTYVVRLADGSVRYVQVGRGHPCK